MFITEERLSILDTVEKLCEYILQSEVVENYLKQFEQLRKDEKALQLVEAFAKQKKIYQEVQRIGKYHPDYIDVIKKTRELKREMDLQESVYAFKQAEHTLQELLDEISTIIGRAVSEQIKVTKGNAYFDSGKCGSCNGGCSC